MVCAQKSPPGRAGRAAASEWLFGLTPEECADNGPDRPAADDACRPALALFGAIGRRRERAYSEEEGQYVAAQPLHYFGRQSAALFAAAMVGLLLSHLEDGPCGSGKGRVIAGEFFGGRQRPGISDGLVVKG